MFSTIQELEDHLLTCRACPLNNETNRGPTTFNGSPASPLMLVGEGPGGVEDEYGVPLVGPSGQLLDKALWSVGIT
ncbi:MAG: uracil-DNA glycosylase, partial [Negativicutes bacterium]|nr:uracil-DNA glycosylase [Negativicutes bacterium]